MRWSELFTELWATFSRGDEVRYEELRQMHKDMSSAMARETQEQKERFYLEVAAHLGNQAAADRLREMDGR